MMALRRCGSTVLVPVNYLHRIDATEELKTKGARNIKEPHKYKDAHAAYGNTLTPDQLAQDLFDIMTTSIHSTSSACLAILFDMLEHPNALSDITQEILQIQGKLQGGVWTRKALGDLRLLDSFMRESARVHALTQCK
jgi:hypothetical protein